MVDLPCAQRHSSVQTGLWNGLYALATLAWSIISMDISGYEHQVSVLSGLHRHSDTSSCEEFEKKTYYLKAFEAPHS